MKLLTAIRKVEDKCGDYESTGNDSLCQLCGFCGRSIAKPDRKPHKKNCPFNLLFEAAARLVPE